MAFERWATYSVVAHQDAAALARDLLLYDKLILPVPPDAAEERRWADPKRNWQPDLLKRRLDQLKDLARAVNWDHDFQKEFHRRLVTMREEVSPMAMTPMVIREWIEPQVRDKGIRVVAAFRSEEDFRRDYLRRPTPAAREATMTFALAHELVVPFAEREPEAALQEAARLARDPEFRAHRRAYYEWQEEIGGRISRGEIDIEGAKRQLREMVDLYNARIAKADRKAKKTLVVTLAGTAISIALAFSGPPGWAALLGAAGAALPMLLVEKPDVSASGAEPAVMLHEMRRTLR
jgi:hypothetical protein